jgi:basic amino acid/polyamine antiporter, APA family
VADANRCARSSGKFVLHLRRTVFSCFGHAGELAVLAVLIGQLAVVNYIGVKTGERVSNFFTAVKVGFLLLFVIAGLVALIARPEIRVPLVWPAPSARGWFDAMLLLVYAYGGFEGALSVGGESTNPKRDTPIALLTALALVAVVYTAVQIVTLKTLPDAAASVRPLGDASQRFLGPAGAMTIAAAALVSAYGYLSANLLHAPRLTFALAEGRDFPSFFGAIHPRYRTPCVSIVVYAVLVFLFAALGTFQWNAVLSAVSRLTVYGAMAVAVPILRQRRDDKAQFQLPFPYFFAGFGLIFSAMLLTQMHRGEFIVVGTTCTIALLNWFFVRR